MAKLLKSKYNSTGERCVDACLNYGELRYVNNDGSPIKIEIPCDKYEEALFDFLDRMKEGIITKTDIDPRDIFKRGSVTYNQAKSLAQEGKIRGLEIFDIDDSIECDHILGISGSVEYALSIWNGESREVALQKSVIRAIKIYEGEFIKELQLDEASNSEDYIMLGKTISSLSKLNNLELFKPKEINIDDDVYDDLTSIEKIMKNINLTLGAIGSVLGLLLVQSITNYGEYIANKYIYFAVTIISVFVIGIIFMKVGKFISDKYIKSNNQSIVEIFNEELEKVTSDNLLAEKECKIILRNITKGEISKLLVNMKGSVNKKLSCNAVVTKEVRFMLDARKVIVLPSEYDIKQAIEKILITYKDKLNKDYNINNI